MFLCSWLVLVALTHITSSTNPGVQLRLTENGLEYARKLVMERIQQELGNITIPDISGTAKVALIGKVQYTLSNMHIVSVGLPESSLDLVPDVGVRVTIPGAFLSMTGNWWVKYLRVIKDSGTVDLTIYNVMIANTIVTTRDDDGRPQVQSDKCAASVGGVSVKFHGGGSWLYNLFRTFIDKSLRSSLEKKMCPAVEKAVSDLNIRLKKMRVKGNVDEYAGMDYSMVSAPPVSNSTITFNLKGEFYNIDKPQEPPFSPVPFSLPPQQDRMMYIGLSAFTSNSAGFVYNTAGALSLYITDDMMPKNSSLPLNTTTFGVFLPEMPKNLLGLAIKLLVRNEETPKISFNNNNIIVQTTAAVTAYAIQPGGTLAPLFVLNMDASAHANMGITGTNLVGTVILNKMTLTLRTSYVGLVRIKSLDMTLEPVLKLVVIPKVNEKLNKGYPLPVFGKLKLYNTKLRVLKEYLLIGTDVEFIP